ncbi:MAG TPA: response regulator transcription factor [Gammaproteobacteria bacterium]|nr:response regulator transcription factor [Gammaproteobacteria bacterium]
MLKKLKEKHVLPDLPIIIISNSVQPVQLKRAIDLGARDYLIKVNFTPDVVVEKVDAVFKEKTKTISPAISRILLIEDEKIIAHFIERTFAKKNYQVFVAVNAREARKILKDEKIDLILLDIILPDVDGFQLLDEFKKDDATKDIPVIIVSNLGQKEEIEKGKERGAVDYIIKSNTIPGEILKKVENILKNR